MESQTQAVFSRPFAVDTKVVFSKAGVAKLLVKVCCGCQRAETNKTKIILVILFQKGPGFQ